MGRKKRTGNKDGSEKSGGDGSSQQTSEQGQQMQPSGQPQQQEAPQPQPSGQPQQHGGQQTQPPGQLQQQGGPPKPPPGQQHIAGDSQPDVGKKSKQRKKPQMQPSEQPQQPSRPQMQPQGQPQQQSRPQMRPPGPPQQQSRPQMQPQGQPQPQWRPQMQPQGQPQQQWGPQMQPPGQQQQQWRPQMQPQGPPQQQGGPQMQPSGQPQQQWRPQMQPQGQPQQQSRPQMRPPGPPQQQSRPQMQPQGQPQQQSRPQMQPQGQPQPQWRPQMQPQGQPQQQGGPQVQPSGQPQQQRGPSKQTPEQQQSPTGSQPDIRKEAKQHQQEQQMQAQGQQQRPGQKKAQKPDRKVPTEEVLKPGVSQAVRNVHEGVAKSPLPDKSPVKTSLPAALQLELQGKIPRRANPSVCGTKGRRITVLTNMMSLLVNQNFQKGAVHYDVIVTPDKPKFMMRPVLEAFRKIHYPNRYPAYDGKKNLYSATMLPFGTHITDTVSVMNEERQKEQSFEVTLNKVNEIDLSVITSTSKQQLAQPGNIECMQVIDTVLRHEASMRFVKVGKSFFNAPRQAQSLSDGMDLWVGSFQCVVLGWKPYLNIDVAHKGFPTSQNVIDLMHELSAQKSYGRNSQPQRATLQDVNYKIRDINDYLKGLKVHYEIPGMPLSKRTVRVNGLVKAANQEIFTLDDGNKCTVEQYFRIQKRYKLQYPDYPCLWIGAREKTIYVPPELCTVMAGQPIMKKLNPDQTRNMIRAAATGTEIRRKKIMDAFNSLNLNNSPSVKNEFGISIQGNFETVPARVLDPPQVHYDGRDTRVQRGVWNVGKFVTPMTMNDNEWTILSMDRRLPEGALYQLDEELRRHAANVGMYIGKSERPFKVIPMPARDNEIISYFEDKKRKKLKLVIVVIPEFGEVYSKVKQITELNVGLVTQCIKRKTVDRLSEATVVNILLKINSKLNGVNHTLAKATRPKVLESRCMIVGADVTHPAPDAVQTPSIAAVTSSFDQEAFQYHIEIRLQPPKAEIIQDMERIINLQLNVFKKNRGYFPDSIIVYRDGVSEGQIPQVLHHELTAIKRGCHAVLSKYLPVTFFVVQKRHNIRLFPTDPRNSDDARKNMNVQAGTIVDTQITHPTHIDFYLVSHASIQGTARPTKYKCIWNDLQMTEDNIEELTYYLCHLFARCTRSVSYPAPTYYAHLAAFRARALTLNVPIRMDKLEEEQRKKLTLMVNHDAPMFFV